MRKIFLTCGLLAAGSFAFAQEAPDTAETFWKNLQTHCGNAYAGELPEGVTHEAFNDKKMVMHVKSCQENEIKIPFYVDEDRSRTWVLTKKDGVITLKHDHRHEDGSEEEITQYGGTSTNVGHGELQFFPADPYTAKLLPAASSNVWWIGLNESIFSYNLKRIHSENPALNVHFDLSKRVDAPEAPWGWKE